MIILNSNSSFPPPLLCSHPNLLFQVLFRREKKKEEKSHLSTEQLKIVAACVSSK